MLQILAGEHFISSFLFLQCCGGVTWEVGVDLYISRFLFTGCHVKGVEVLPVHRSVLVSDWQVSSLLPFC